MTDYSKYNLTLTRVLDAPRERVFQAWTDPKLISQWWGPRGFTAPVTEFDAQPGGAINIVMEDAAGLIEKGSRYPMDGTVKEVVAPERLVFTSRAIMNDQPVLENLVTVTFEGENGKTKLTVRVEIIKATPEAEGPLAGMEMGWSQQLDKLAELLG